MFKINNLLSPVPDTEKVELDIFTICKGHHEVTYRGVKAIRCPFDYVIYQMILSEVKPDLVIEIGTNIGGGALYIADLMNNMQHGIIHTIDIKKQSDPILATHPRIRLFTEGWQNYNLEEAKGFAKILVIEDSSHLYQDTLEVLRKFGPLVSKDSYLIVEDGIVNKLGLEKEYQGGPLKAIREFLQESPEFVVDRKWCDLFGRNATFNVNGYLRKK
jgi:cephalosporin hydroxylase